MCPGTERSHQWAVVAYSRCGDGPLFCCCDCGRFEGLIAGEDLTLEEMASLVKVWSAPLIRWEDLE
jgi:hypothetical protein